MGAELESEGNCIRTCTNLSVLVMEIVEPSSFGTFKTKNGLWEEN